VETKRTEGEKGGDGGISKRAAEDQWSRRGLLLWRVVNLSKHDMQAVKYMGVEGVVETVGRMMQPGRQSERARARARLEPELKHTARRTGLGPARDKMSTEQSENHLSVLQMRLEESWLGLVLGGFCGALITA
jgi:hypothetical protein